MINIFKHLRPSSRLRVARLRNAIVQTIHKAAKSRLITSAIERAESEGERATRALGKLREEFANIDEHPGRQAGAELQSRGNIALATTFDFADLAIQGLICYANFSRFGLPVVILATLGITVGLTAMGFGIVHSLADDSRPEQSIARGKAISLALTTMVVVSGFIVAYLRFAGADSSDSVFEQASTAWWILAEVLPIAAGAWLAVAYQRSYPLLVEAEIREQEEYERELRGFLTWLRDQASRITTPTNPSAVVGHRSSASSASTERVADDHVGELASFVDAGAPSDTTHTLKTVGGATAAHVPNSTRGSVAIGLNNGAALVLAIFFMPLMAHAGAVRAQGSADHPRLTQTSSAVGVSAAEHVCAVAVDRGPNGVVSSRLAAIEVTVARLHEWVTARQCTSLVVTAFADAGAYTPRVSFDVPQVPRSGSCDSAKAGKVDTRHAPLVVFGGYEEHRQRQARDRCAVDRAKADSVFTLDWTVFIRKIRAAVAQEQVSPPLSSAISPLLSSLFSVGVADILVVSTGIDGAGIPERLPQNTRVLIIGFEAKEGFLGRAATDAAAEKWKHAGAHVLTAQQLTPGVLARVALSNGS